ncbi:hypothetical protein A7K94_0221575, partial [Modestobacter sp. VKM Ac-2676]
RGAHASGCRSRWRHVSAASSRPRVRAAGAGRARRDRVPGPPPRPRVTESLLEGGSSAAVATLQALRTAGLRVSIDDFGTGWSSLSRLDTLPADVLKLDHSFIATVHCSPRRAQMLQSLVAMCRGLGLDVVAEGVETADQEAAVRAMGCTFAQGWRYGRPVPLPELLAGLSAGREALLLDAAYRG